jgi:hypothetical protein
MHRDMDDVIHELQCRIQYPVDLVSEYDSYSGFLSFFEGIERNRIFGDLSCDNKHSFLFREVDGFRRMAELLESDILFRS